MNRRRSEGSRPASRASGSICPSRPRRDEEKVRSGWSAAARRMFALETATARTRTKAGVGVLVFDRTGRLLLERRSDCGLWGLPGGRIEPGESVRAAAIREVAEETGLTIRVMGLQGVYSEPWGRIVRYPDNGDQRHLIDIVVTARVTGGRMKASHESLELKWVRRADVPWDELCPAARDPVRHAFEGAAPVLG